MRNTYTRELDNTVLEYLHNVTILLEKSDVKGFRKFCDDINLLLSNDEELVKSLIISCKDNLYFLDILWNYVPEKYENIINDLLKISHDPILSEKAKNRSNTDKYNDKYFKGSDITKSVSMILESRDRGFF